MKKGKRPSLKHMFSTFESILFQNPNVSGSRKKVRIAPELSELVIYCQSVPFTASVENDVVNFIEGPCTALSSFNETKAKSVMVEHNRMAFQRHHQRQLSRIYPKVLTYFIPFSLILFITLPFSFYSVFHEFRLMMWNDYF